MISKSDTILIAGCSWGCGEWSGPRGNYTLLHKGLEHFLTEYGCKVINVSKPHGNNLTAIKNIKNTLSTTHIDHIFWFKTSPIRDLRPFDLNQDKLPQTSEEYHQIVKELSIETYKSLNDLGVKIQCMGGIGHLQESIKDYPNLIPLIPSIIEMFGGQEPEHWIENWIDTYKDKVFDEKFLLKLERMPNPREKLPKKWFEPDGIHPNRHAHYKIFKYILEQHK